MSMSTEPSLRALAAKPARPILDLAGLWDFRFEGPTARLAGEDQRIRVPGIWQTQFPELRNAQGAGRYRRKVALPPDWAGKHVWLVTEGVFHTATILVDEKPVAAISNGWTETAVDITEAVDGVAPFTIGVDAQAPDDRGSAVEGFGFTLAGKQDWYGIHGGIWKSVRLEARCSLHFQSVTVQASTDLKSHRLSVCGALSAPEAASLRVQVSRAGSLVAAMAFPIAGARFEVMLDVADVALWSPDAPNLYDVAVSLMIGEEVVDAVEKTIGFRRFEARDSRLFLNGEPFYLVGALDQDWYPEEDCRSPSEAFLEERFRNAKAMGLNTLRCHVKIPDRLYFDLADRMGLIVWQDMPYMEFLAPSSREQLRDVFARAVETHGHHPSIAIWTIFNEGWGIDLDDNPDDRRWLIETFDAAKALVPNALVVDNSPCFPRNYHLKTDIEDFHWYNAFPSQNADFERTTRDFAARAPWAWSPHGDAVKSGPEPLICSEFGVWGLPHPEDILEKDGSEPWWFESGHDWNSGAAYPHGVATRFRDAGLAPIFGDLGGFVDAAQELQFRGLKYQIETLRWASEISGYVITELNDVQWEANGLMDVANHPRRFAERLAELQRPWLIIARSPRSSLGAGERVDVAVRLAGVAEAPPGARLAWRFGGEAGVIPIGAEPSDLSLCAALAAEITIDILELEARDASGHVLSRNHLEFCVSPPLDGSVPAFHAMDARAAEILTATKWPNVASTPEQAERLLATRLTGAVREQLIAGRETLLIANDPEALIDPERRLPASDLHNFPTMEMRPRAGSPWDGRWMGAFSWRRTDGPWARLPNGPMLDEHWIGLLPNFVLTGFRSTAFGGLVDAGVAVAWLHKAAAFSKRSFLGRGWMTVSTFDLTSRDGLENPLSSHLLLALARSRRGPSTPP